MSTERGAAMPGPDDFDRQLRELTSAPGTPRFREPSAAERARTARKLRGKALRKRRAPQGTPGRSRRQRLLVLAKGAAILVGFVALLVLMHALGLGPR